MDNDTTNIKKIIIEESKLQQCKTKKLIAKRKEK